MMKKLSLVFCLLLVMFTSCDQRKITRTDTLTSGYAELAVDESLAPIIQSQVDVFEAVNQEATVIPIYTSEIEVYRQLVDDSVHLIVGARELTAGEKAKIEARKLTIRSQKLALDGIALVVNNTNSVSRLTVKDLSKIFTGEINNWKELDPSSKLGEIKVSFDNPNSSMARYMRDDICNGKPFGANVKARSADTAESIDIHGEKTANQRVMDYVRNTPNALGVIGVNWISNPSDSLNLSFTDKLKVLAVSNEDEALKSNSYQPYPYQLALKKYPLTRDIYIIITDVRGGLTAGFVNFAAGDQGQRIITKAGLIPATRPTRMIRVNQTW